MSTVEYVPGAHMEHTLSWPDPANEPDAHELQLTAAMRSEKVPTAHGKQYAREPTDWKVPFGHGRLLV
jgi:hypothetical protein